MQPDRSLWRGSVGFVRRSLVKRRARGLCSGLFAAPHSAEDLVGYVEPVGSSGFASGLLSLAFRAGWAAASSGGFKVLNGCGLARC